MHFLLKTEDFVQNRFLILHFWLRKKVYFEEKPSTFGGSFCCISAQFLTFSIAYSAQHCCKNTSKTLPYQSCKFGGLWTILKIFDPKLWEIIFAPNSSPFHFWSLRAQQGASTLQNHFPACFFDAPYNSIKFRPDWSTLIFFCSKGPPFALFFVFDHSEHNKVQAHFKITTQLIFLMPPTSPASFVQIGALWIFFVPRVPPLHHFSFLVAHTPTRCKQTSKSRPSLLFWWSPQVLQVSARLENFEFFLFQGSPLWLFSGFW